MTKTTKTDIAAEVRHAIETAPSLVALNAAIKKIGELGIQQVAITSELNQLCIDLNAGKDTPGALARDLLDTGTLSATRIGESIAGARRRLGVVVDAISLQTSIVRELRGKVTQEVNQALKAVRQPLVVRSAAALKELQEVAAEDGKVLASLTHSDGVNPALIGTIGFAPIAWGTDQAWLKERRAEGYSV